MRSCETKSEERIRHDVQSWTSCLIRSSSSFTPLLNHPMTSQDLLALLQAEPIDIDRLDHALNAADHPARLGFLRLLTPKHQRRLFDAAKGRPLTLDDLVPPGTPPMTEVICEGQNTLPAFRAFQKRFCSPPPAQSGRQELWGYNHQTLSRPHRPWVFRRLRRP